MVIRKCIDKVHAWLIYKIFTVKFYYQWIFILNRQQKDRLSKFLNKEWLEQWLEKKDSIEIPLIEVSLFEKCIDRILKKNNLNSTYILPYEEIFDELMLLNNINYSSPIIRCLSNIISNNCERYKIGYDSLYNQSNTFKEYEDSIEI